MTRCKQCLAYAPSSDYEGYGRCHLLPPEVMQDREEEYLSSRHPMVDGTGWCVQAVPIPDSFASDDDRFANQQGVNDR